MSETSRLLLPRRVSPGVLVACVWISAALYALLTQSWQPRLVSGVAPFPPPHRAMTTPPFHRNSRVLSEAGVGAALSCLACLFLTRRPLWSTTILVLSALTLTSALSTSNIAPDQYLPVCVALYFVAAEQNRRTALIASASALTGLTGYVAVRLAMGTVLGTSDISVEAVVLLMVVVAWVLGDSHRREALHGAEIRRRTAEQAVTTERLRIARELHDTVAHSISVVALQAGAAQLVIETQPEGVRKALGVIEDTSRQTLAGLRRVLGFLYDAGSAETGTPPAGLDDVDRLLANVRSAGFRVDLEWRGERRPLPPEIDLSAFRIIQESVTNVMKHSGTRQCRVSVVFDSGNVSVVVVDSGPGSGRGRGTGYGIAGMRDRVELLHGDFSAGPRPEGGFRVTARLPVPAEA